MSILIGLLFALFASSRGENNESVCDGVEAKSFNLATVLGSWYVVGVVTYGQRIPEKANPCFRVEFSEADETGLNWLLDTILKSNETSSNETDWADRVSGTTIRQRYHIDHPYDTWSRNLEATKGCFEEVLTIYSNEQKIVKSSENNPTKSTMQLHVLDPDDGLGPYLLQLLWGDKLSAVIYRRRPGRVTKLELQPSMNLLDKIRVGQILTRICEKTPQKPRQVL